MKKLLISMVFVIFLTGCSFPTYKVTPIKQVLNHAEIFDANISIVNEKAIVLTLRNKTNEDLEINWNKTMYISQGKTSGTFMFEGVSYLNRNSPKPSDVVFAKSNVVKILYPNINVYFHKGWNHKDIGIGVKGILLVMEYKGKEIKQKIISRVEIEKK